TACCTIMVGYTVAGAEYHTPRSNFSRPAGLPGSRMTTWRWRRHRPNGREEEAIYLELPAFVGQVRRQRLAIELEITLSLQALQLRGEAVALAAAVEQLVEQGSVDTHVRGRLQMLRQGTPDVVGRAFHLVAREPVKDCLHGDEQLAFGHREPDARHLE